MPSPKEVFQPLDRDHDGKLSPEEFAAGMARFHHRGDSPSHPSREPARHGQAGRHRPTAASMVSHGKEIFAQLDTDKDGKINRAEAPERLKAHFDEIDANKDGQLTPDELKKAFEARFGHRSGAARPGKPEGESQRGHHHGKRPTPPPEKKPAEQK